MRQSPLLLLYLLCLSALSGCGQSGPLYLPSDPQNPVDIQTPSNRELF